MAVPVTPSNLVATATGRTSIVLTWTDNSSDETSFRIERSLHADSGFAEITAVVPGVTSHNDSGLTQGTSYFYRVKARGAGGDSPYSAIAHATTDAPADAQTELTDTDRLALLPGFDSTAYSSDALELAVTAARTAIERYCNRVFGYDTYEETLDGDGTDTLYLEQWPIIAVTEVTIDDVAVTDYDIVTPPGGKANSLYREDGWTSGRRNIVVTYAAGYSSIPDDLSMIATMLAADILRSSQRDANMTGERIDDYSASWSVDSASTALLLEPYKNALSPFRRWVI